MQKNSKVCLVWLAGAVMFVTAEHATAQKSLPIPEKWQATIAKTEALGWDLFVIEGVSGIGIDALKKNVTNYDKLDLAGFLTIRDTDENARPADTYSVFFYDSNEPARLKYKVRVSITGGTKLEFKAFEPPEESPPAFRAQLRARKIAREAIPDSGQSIKTVVMPGAANDEKGILVYVLATSRKPDICVMGRHFRVLVPEEGGPPAYVMPFSYTPIEMPIKGPDGREPSSLGTTQLVTELPVETHVLASLQCRIPIFVASKSGLWNVDGRKISLVGPPPKAFDGK